MRMMETEDPWSSGRGGGDGQQGVRPWSQRQIIRLKTRQKRWWPTRSCRVTDHFPQDLDILSTLADSEGEVGKVLEGSESLGSPGRARTVERRADISLQEVLHEGLRVMTPW